MAGNLLKLAILFLGFSFCVCHGDLKLKIVTVATYETDSYLRFMESAKVNELDVDVFGLREQGGAQKLNILREGLKKYKDDKDLVLMFTDSYDAIFTSGESEILEKFKKSRANILLSAEDHIWPGQSLASRYPALEGDGYRYLCTGGIIGYAPSLYEMITLKANNHTHTDDDQLYYTHIYLDGRDKYKLKLDNRANLFQNLNDNKEHVEIDFERPEVRVVNKRFKTTPVVIYGSGSSKLFLNYLGNYMPKKWTRKDGCLSCNESKINLDDIQKKDWPTIFLGVFIPTLTPFLNPFLRHISALDYPKDKIHVFIHNMHYHHSSDVEEWIEEVEESYKSILYFKDHKDTFFTEQQARNLAIFHWRKLKTDYFFAIDSIVTLSNKKTLQILIEQNRTIISPMVSKPQKLWSNFWGDVTSEGYYARSRDYMDVVKKVRRGVWNIPYMSLIYLISSSVMDQIGVDPFQGEDHDFDMQFCANLRDKNIFMYVTNLDHFGHIKSTKSYVTQHKSNDLYQIFDNQLDWEEKYLHPEYIKYLAEGSDIPQPCRDVFWVPMVTDAYAKEMIEECEFFGQWSGGKHKDSRVSGGYENVPTVDIHMNQIGFEEQWMYMLKTYFSPMVSRIFQGYISGNQAVMNFVVKYSTTGQYFLRPHHDASTYTINLALNRAGVDFEGGGARFMRYNCSIPNTKMGWALMHPGRLTHQHEGLPITKGLRYIMISFVDP